MRSGELGGGYTPHHHLTHHLNLHPANLHPPSGEARDGRAPAQLRAVPLYAQRVGAEVFATASQPKHAYLRSLGIEHISTSRDADVFAAEMTDMVGERGVDVVLNSLTSGKYIENAVQ